MPGLVITPRTVPIMTAAAGEVPAATGVSAWRSVVTVGSISDHRISVSSRSREPTQRYSVARSTPRDRARVCMSIRSPARKVRRASRNPSSAVGRAGDVPASWRCRGVPAVRALWPAIRAGSCSAGVLLVDTVTLTGAGAPRDSLQQIRQTSQRRDA